MQSAMLAASIVSASAGGSIPLTWADCSDETFKTKIHDLTPASIQIGSTTTITGTGTLLEDIAEDVQFEGTLSLSLDDCTGDAQVGKSCNFPLDTGSIAFSGIDFPIKAGEVPIEVDLKISKLLPAEALKSVAEIRATSASKGALFCLNVHTLKSGFNQLGVTWEDCSEEAGALVPVSSLTPDTIKEGQLTKFIGKGMLPEDIELDDVVFDMKLKVQLIDCKGSAFKTTKCNLPLALGYMEFQGIPNPVPAGETAISVDMKLSNLIPSAIVDSTTHVVANTASGAPVFCLDVYTKPQTGNMTIV